MDRYSINEVEQYTGINAFSLRAWEKRYNTLIPHRTETNIRYYDDEQLQMLLNVSLLLPAGHRISNLMSLTRADLNRLVIEQEEAGADPGSQHAAAINKLIGFMLAFDEASFDKLLTAAIKANGIFEVLTKIVYPFLVRTGVLWTTKGTTPAQEHFAANIIRRKLHAAIDRLKPSPIHSETFILFLPPDEQHEIGLLLADYLLRKAGKKTVYLGADLPYSTLKDAVIQLRPTHLLTFLTTGSSADERIAAIKKSTAGKSCNILVCAGTHLKINAKIPSKVRILNDPEAILEYLL